MGMGGGQAGVSAPHLSPAQWSCGWRALWQHPAGSLGQGVVQGNVDCFLWHPVDPQVPDVHQVNDSE